MENNLTGALEAILFAAGEPLEIDKIAGVMEIDEAAVSDVCLQLQNQYDERNAGITVLRLKDKLQLCTRKEYFNVVREALEIKRNAPLSQAAFEVLAVIAYNQPVTKSFIEQVRGVDCSGVVSSLCEKGLIEEQGRLDLPGRPLLYGTTDSFLRCFGLSSLADLPPIPRDENEGDGDGNNSDDAAATGSGDDTAVAEEVIADTADNDTASDSADNDTDSAGE